MSTDDRNNSLTARPLTAAQRAEFRAVLDADDAWHRKPKSERDIEAARIAARERRLEQIRAQEQARADAAIEAGDVYAHALANAQRAASGVLRWSLRDAKAFLRRGIAAVLGMQAKSLEKDAALDWLPTSEAGMTAEGWRALGELAIDSYAKAYAAPLGSTLRERMAASPEMPRPGLDGGGPSPNDTTSATAMQIVAAGAKARGELPDNGVLIFPNNPRGRR